MSVRGYPLIPTRGKTVLITQVILDPVGYTGVGNRYYSLIHAPLSKGGGLGINQSDRGRDELYLKDLLFSSTKGREEYGKE